MSTNFTFKAIGTSWTIDIPQDVENEEGLLCSIKNRIDEFDKTYSRFREDSLVFEMSRKVGTYTLPEDASLMFSFYRELYEITNGKVTPLIGGTLVGAGYDLMYSLKPKENIQKTKKWDDVIKYNHPKLEIKEPTMLDFGAVGKGYLVELVADVLRGNKISEYMINAGGDIAYRNSQNKPLRVGLENPENSNEVVGVAEVINCSICGSSGNRRVWEKYHHIMDPDTIESPRHILGLWVVAKSTYLADGLATALFFVEPELLLKKYDFEYVILYADHSLKKSEKFPGQLFT